MLDDTNFDNGGRRDSDLLSRMRNMDHCRLLAAHCVLVRYIGGESACGLAGIRR